MKKDILPAGPSRLMRKMTARTAMWMLCASAIPITAALMPSAAFAQEARGSVYGETLPSTTVTLRDVDTGVVARTVSNSAGYFRFPELAPGRYVATNAEGSTSEIDVSAGISTPVRFEATTVVVVTGRRVVNPIDVKSVESASVFTATQIETLPVVREVSSVALLAPGTVRNSHPLLEDSISIGGSSPAENGYYINGFDVTNIRNFTTYADLPFDGVSQVQVKTGGYGAEYGRSLGGVLSQVTKRGTNRWRFGASATVSPDSWSARGRDAVSIDPDHAGGPEAYQVFTSANREALSTYSVHVGGPIIQDKLFVFALYEGRDDRRDIYESLSSHSTKNTSPQTLLKVDYYLTPDHHFEYTGIQNKSVTAFKNYSNIRLDADGVPEFDDFGWPVYDYYQPHHGHDNGGYDLVSGGSVNILNYSGRFTDNLTLSMMYGRLDNLFYVQQPGVAYPEAAACVAADDSRMHPDFMIPVGCWNEAQFVIPDLGGQPNRDRREAFRIDAEWTLDNHLIRLGYDAERFSSAKQGQMYSGGAYYRYYTVDEEDGRAVNGEMVPVGTTYVRERTMNVASAVYKVENTAFYIEDNWQITPNLLLYAGLRNETFANRNAAGEMFAEADNQLAPRLGFSWDPTGEGRAKIFGTFGRYYIPVSTNTNIRMAGIEYHTEAYFVVEGYDPETGRPVGEGALIGPEYMMGSQEPYPAVSLVSKNLEPMYQDELIVGAQKEFTPDLTLGVRSIYRKVGAGMDDVCSKQPFIDWAIDKGMDDFDLNAVPTCYLMNPGRNAILEFDANGDGTFDLVDVDAKYFGLPDYKREYLSLELFGAVRGEKWMLDGSYTLSFSRGNSEGYVNSSLGFAEPGLSQDWDNYMVARGSGGYLPNDRRHSLKLFGTYRVNDEFLIGGNFVAQSGMPLNCFGFVDLNDPGLGVDVATLAFQGASSFYCARPDGMQVLGQRGDAGRGNWVYNMDASVTYTPQKAGGKVSFQAVVYNLFDSRATTRYNQVSQNGYALAPTYNRNFLGPLQFQSPRRAQLTVRYNF